MEMIGGGLGRDNKVYGTCHYGDGTSLISRGGNTEIIWPEKLSDDYHIYAIEWDSTSIKWYFDNTEYFSVNITSADQEELRSEQYHFKCGSWRSLAWFPGCYNYMATKNVC